MKETKMRFFWFVILLLGIVGVLVYVRVNSTMVLKTKLHTQWEEKFVVSSGDSAYVKTNTSQKEDVVLSEGQGYGMLIATEAAKQGRASQKDFNKLYQYYLKNRIVNTQLMSWQQTRFSSGKVESSKNNATDGDLYIAYALIKAAKQWPKQAKEYQAQAKAILKDILAYNYNSKTGVLTVGNWATVDSKYYTLMRTSDVNPAQFEAFYELTGDSRWQKIEQTMLKVLDTISNQYQSGLIPDFVWVTSSGVTVAKANDIASKYDGAYASNACRLPYQLAQSKNETSQKVLKKMMKFFMSQTNLSAGYQLNGSPLNRYQSANFDAPIYYAAVRNNDYNRLVQATKYILMQDLSPELYYDSALTTLVALGSL